MSTILRRFALGCALAFAGLFPATAGRASAAPLGPTFHVNSTADAVDANAGNGVCETGAGNGVCTLRAALMEANQSTDTVIHVPAGIYTLALTGTGSLVATKPMSILGAGAATTVIQGGAGWNARLLLVSGWGVHAQGLTFRLGHVPDGAGAGGAIHVNTGAALRLESSQVTQNRAEYGGGIAAYGVLTLTGSSVISNTAVRGGGGIDSYVNGVIVMHNSIVAANTLSISLASTGGGIATRGIVIAQNSAIRGNVSGSAGGLYLGTDGWASFLDSVIADNATGDGGGAGIMLTNARMVMTRTSVTRNAVMYGNDGGGIEVSSSHAFIVDSAFVGNTAAGGAGIANSGWTTLTNVTLSGNVATAYGGGIRNRAMLFLHNVSIISNTSGISLTGGTGGGIYAQSGSVSLRNTMLAGNANVLMPGLSPDCNGTLNSAGYSLIGNVASCAFIAATGDITNTDAKVKPLGDNGGPTPTHALMGGSPAINAGDPAGCAAPNGGILIADQRGSPRPLMGRCDIGAYEGGSVIYLPISMRDVNAAW